MCFEGVALKGRAMVALRSGRVCHGGYGISTARDVHTLAHLEQLQDVTGAMGVLHLQVGNLIQFRLQPQEGAQVHSAQKLRGTEGRALCTASSQDEASSVRRRRWGEGHRWWRRMATALALM